MMSGFSFERMKSDAFEKTSDPICDYRRAFFDFFVVFLFADFFAFFFAAIFFVRRMPRTESYASFDHIDALHQL